MPASTCKMGMQPKPRNIMHHTLLLVQREAHGYVYWRFFHSVCISNCWSGNNSDLAWHWMPKGVKHQMCMEPVCKDVAFNQNPRHSSKHTCLSRTTSVSMGSTVAAFMQSKYLLIPCKQQSSWNKKTPNTIQETVVVTSPMKALRKRASIPTLLWEGQSLVDTSGARPGWTSLLLSYICKPP